jgi:cytochrome b6-f complex iron-sulfur subunit
MAGKRLKRRELLSWGLIAASAALAVQSCDVVLRFARPAAVAGEFGGAFDLGAATDLPDVDAPPTDHRAGRFFFVHTSAGIAAFHKVCTHLSCLLTWDEQADAFVCPCHGSLFSRAGEVISGPAARDLDRFVVQLIAADGQVVATSDPHRGEPVAVPKTTSPATSTNGTPPAADGDTASASDADEGKQETATDPALRVIVDTGRMIRGRPAGERTPHGA